MNKKLVMHVISGTHWDREWRHTAEQSKPRLAELVDKIIDVLEKKKDYKAYCLDGGLVVIEDYLTVRPENRDRLKKLIQAGRLNLVNWYTLPDTFTVAPEALLRNIKKGRDMAMEFGGAMSSGYTATSYGQTSQLPQIYNGFGIKNAIFYRGTNKHILDPLFSWEGIDGSRLFVLRTFDEVTRTNWFFYVHQVLVLDKPPADLSYTYNRKHVPVHMCDSQLYERAFVVLRETPSFKDDEDSLKAALDLIVNQAKPYMVGNNILALNMEDNDVPFELLPEMIKALNKVSPGIDIQQSTLDEYMASICKNVDHSNLKCHKGELRYPAVEPGFNGLLGSTHSSRVLLKILNEQAETGLLFQAEPFASINSMLGGEYPVKNLDRAWQHLLLNHAHDSICGAAVDQAHKDMLYNFSIAKMVGEEITARSCVSIFSNIKTSGVFEPADHTITLFNSLPWPRKKVHLLTIDLPRNESAGGVVDPCTGVGNVTDETTKFFDIIDTEGNLLPCEILSKEDIQIAVERELDTKSIKMPSTRRRILVEAEVPPLGYATYALRPRGPHYIAHPENGPDRPLIARENGVLENSFLKVTINPNGTFSMLNKETGRLVENQHYFTDSGEVGNAHFTTRPQRNPIGTSLGAQAQITMIMSNRLRGVYRIDLLLTVPAAATLDGRDRLNEKTDIPVSMELTLDKGSRYLVIHTRLTNTARDHRLQVNFPTKIKSDYAEVESAFAIEKRCVRWTETGDNFEQFYQFQPMQNFVDISDGSAGVAILNKGLREYEIKDDADRTIAITLLRTQRAYMTANTDMTPDELNKYTGQHSLGELQYRYALYPHSGNWQEGKVLQEAYNHKVTVNAVQGVPIDEGTLPASGSFFRIEPDTQLMLSALKQADSEEGIIMRLWNISDKKLNATITTILPVSSVQRCQLDETPIQPLETRDGKISLEISPHKIETIMFKRTG